MESLKQLRLADIVTEFPGSAPVLEKYKLDFCCKGKRTLAQACDEQNLPLEQVETELGEVSPRTDAGQSLFQGMNPKQLSDYIVARHHVYVKQAIPTILNHLEKLYQKHSDRYPHVPDVYNLFRKMAEELSAHMVKEECILFPMMDQLDHLSKAQLMGPISVMEAEHDEAGDIIAAIRELTNDYSPPADACTTHKLVLLELRQFEEDLHQHVYLENHLLFPKAVDMVVN
jgi:regulator of cell morphogenesis and NO signaling